MPVLSRVSEKIFPTFAPLPKAILHGGSSLHQAIAGKAGSRAGGGRQQPKQDTPPQPRAPAL